MNIDTNKFLRTTGIFAIVFFILCGLLTCVAELYVDEEDKDATQVTGKTSSSSDSTAEKAKDSTAVQVSAPLEEDPYEELESLIGLEEVKKEVKSLANYVKTQKMRSAQGLKTPKLSYHLVFTGSPGTGKTTVARIVARIYKDLGILKSGHTVETDRSGLVAEYMGQTAIKTNQLIDKAIDGVLFIDEAYSLVPEGGSDRDYGQEAISTLLKRMEDDRDKLVVIIAGYPNEMNRFINSNPGLKSRFNKYINFPDYTADELYRIFCMYMNKNEYTISDEASKYLKQRLEYVVEHKDRNFGNARFCRNTFEKAIQQQANRLVGVKNPTKSQLTQITLEDIQAVI